MCMCICIFVNTHYVFIYLFIYLNLCIGGIVGESISPMNIFCEVDMQLDNNFMQMFLSSWMYLIYGVYI